MIGKMAKIEIVNFGTIPARTKVEVINIPFPKGDVVIDASTLTKQYECMDCSFKTTDVNQMLEHQVNQSKVHNIWQRFMRWWHS